MATNMEVDGGNPKPQTGVMASAGTSGSVSISLHPLVIMNISEHWTRVRSQEGKPKQGIRAITKYSRLSLSRLRLSRITTYLEEKN